MIQDHRRPPVLDMTPEGEFRDTSSQGQGRPGARARAGLPPLAGRTWLDRALLRLGGVAALVVAVGGALLLAAVGLVVVGVLLPVLAVAALVAFVTLWWRLRRARREGRPAFVVVRR